MTDPEQIAAKLTKAQRECLLDAYERDVPWDAQTVEVRGRSANSLSLKGLATGREFRSLTGKTRRGLALTDLGQQVRAILMSNADAQRLV